MSSFPFVQFELAGALGIDDGRYPVRAHRDTEPGPTDAVLVCRTFGAPAPPRRRRRPKPRAVTAGEVSTIPVTQLTVIAAEPIPGDPAAWLDELRGDEGRRTDLVNQALAHVRRAVGARRIAAGEPALGDPSAETAMSVRIGFGDGEALVDGEFEQAIEVPRDPERLSRAAALRPQERMAAMLGGRARRLPCQELVLRARSDLEAGRGREAALQIRVGLEALLADRDAFTGAAQEQDLGFLDGRRGITGDAANEALRGEPSPERAAEVAATVAVCERVLRRRAALG